MDPLSFAIVTGLVGGFVGWMDHLFTTSKTSKELEEEKKRQEKLYTLQLEEAKLDYEKAQKEAKRNAEKANLQADLTDKAQDISEHTISNDINTAIDNLYLSQASDAYEWNQQAMASGASEGASYTGLAASGIRAGSSLSDAVEMQAATNSELLQFAQDSKRRSDNNNLGSVLNQLAGNEFNIMQNRIGADETRKDALDLVNSYLEGGTNYNIYQNQLKQMETQHTYNLDKLNKEIKKNSPDSFEWWMGAGASLFGMTSQGFSTGYNLGDTIYKGKKYNTSVGGKASTGSAEG